MLTKHVPKELLNAHLMVVGVDIRGGRAESAPTLDQLEMYTEEWTENVRGEGRMRGYEENEGKRVRFCEKVRIRPVEATGKGRKTAEARKTRASKYRGPGGDRQEAGKAV